MMMYAPLHTVIWEDQHGDAWFTVDQPSKQFASFDIPEITEVGIELDHKLVALLDALEVPVSSELEEWRSRWLTARTTKSWRAR
jgi:hypothetical protein